VSCSDVLITSVTTADGDGSVLDADSPANAAVSGRRRLQLQRALAQSYRLLIGTRIIARTNTAAVSSPATPTPSAVASSNGTDANAQASATADSSGGGAAVVASPLVVTSLNRTALLQQLASKLSALSAQPAALLTLFVAEVGARLNITAASVGLDAASIAVAYAPPPSSPSPSAVAVAAVVASVAPSAGVIAAVTVCGTLLLAFGAGLALKRSPHLCRARRMAEGAAGGEPTQRDAAQASVLVATPTQARSVQPWVPGAAVARQGVRVQPLPDALPPGTAGSRAAAAAQASEPSLDREPVEASAATALVIEDDAVTASHPEASPVSQHGGDTPPPPAPSPADPGRSSAPPPAPVTDSAVARTRPHAASAVAPIEHEVALPPHLQAGPGRLDFSAGSAAYGWIDDDDGTMQSASEIAIDAGPAVSRGQRRRSSVSFAPGLSLRGDESASARRNSTLLTAGGVRLLTAFTLGARSHSSTLDDAPLASSRVSAPPSRLSSVSASPPPPPPLTAAEVAGAHAAQAAAAAAAAAQEPLTATAAGGAVLGSVVVGSRTFMMYGGSFAGAGETDALPPVRAPASPAATLPLSPAARLRSPLSPVGSPPVPAATEPPTPVASSSSGGELPALPAGLATVPALVQAAWAAVATSSLAAPPASLRVRRGVKKAAGVSRDRFGLPLPPRGVISAAGPLPTAVPPVASGRISRVAAAPTAQLPAPPSSLLRSRPADWAGAFGAVEPAAPPATLASSAPHTASESALRLHGHAASGLASVPASVDQAASAASLFTPSLTSSVPRTGAGAMPRQAAVAAPTPAAAAAACATESVAPLASPASILSPTAIPTHRPVVPLLRLPGLGGAIVRSGEPAAVGSGLEAAAPLGGSLGGPATDQPQVVEAAAPAAVLQTSEAGVAAASSTTAARTGTAAAVASLRVASDDAAAIAAPTVSPQGAVAAGSKQGFAEASPAVAARPSFVRRIGSGPTSPGGTPPVAPVRIGFPLPPARVLPPALPSRAISAAAIPRTFALGSAAVGATVAAPAVPRSAVAPRRPGAAALARPVGRASVTSSGTDYSAPLSTARSVSVGHPAGSPITASSARLSARASVAAAAGVAVTAAPGAAPGQHSARRAATPPPPSARGAATAGASLTAAVPPPLPAAAVAVSSPPSGKPVTSPVGPVLATEARHLARHASGTRMAGAPATAAGYASSGLIKRTSVRLAPPSASIGAGAGSASAGSGTLAAESAPVAASLRRMEQSLVKRMQSQSVLPRIRAAPATGAGVIGVEALGSQLSPISPVGLSTPATAAADPAAFVGVTSRSGALSEAAAAGEPTSTAGSIVAGSR
jgi:hypothetical protein